MKEKIIVGLFYLACLIMVFWGGKAFLSSTISSRDDQEFQRKYTTERCHFSADRLKGAEGERIIEKYGTYTCYVVVNGIWTQLTDYDMDKILKVRQ